MPCLTGERRIDQLAIKSVCPSKMNSSYTLRIWDAIFIPYIVNYKVGDGSYPSLMRVNMSCLTLHSCRLI